LIGSWKKAQDKASYPVNMMGASKRIMEFFLEKYSNHIQISTARFANVAFSEGSLLHSWVLRMQKRQPIVAPKGEEARRVAPILPEKQKWAVYFSDTDTTGEKEYESFFEENEEVVLDKFKDIGVVRFESSPRGKELDCFLRDIERLRKTGWQKKDILKLFRRLLPNFTHEERGKYLDDKM